MALKQQLHVCLMILRQTPFTQFTETTQMDGPTIIQYGEQLGIIKRKQHPLGDLLYLEDRTAVQLTYFRNNINHLFVLPSLIGCYILSHSQTNLQELVTFVRIMYPFLKSELYLPWSDDALDEAIRQAVVALVSNQLIEAQSSDETLRCPRTGSTQYLNLSVLASTIRQTLERYYIALALLLKHGSHTIGQQELEEQCYLMAQRISFLYEFNAPEFFDKALFKSFVSTLKGTGIVEEDASGQLCYEKKLIQLYDASRTNLSTEVRRAIRQVTQDSTGV